MEALTNAIEEKIMKKIILPSRSGDDGAPCAIARLVLAQAPISNQQKPKHKNLPQNMAFHLHVQEMFHTSVSDIDFYNDYIIYFHCINSYSKSLL